MVVVVMILIIMMVMMMIKTVRHLVFAFCQIPTLTPLDG